MLVKARGGEAAGGARADREVWRGRPPPRHARRRRWVPHFLLPTLTLLETGWATATTAISRDASHMGLGILCLREMGAVAVPLRSCDLIHLLIITQTYC